MNEKSSVTKQLHAKHIKILEELLKLPENRNCADCNSKGPRWASVNIGMFICLQCSGIHRSLGVHISKVRSTTLDTWLPDQVAFLQSMGNAKSNAYWEAELPPYYRRDGIENFIRAKYVDRRWVPKNQKLEPAPFSKEELAISSSPQNGEGTTERTSTQHLYKQVEKEGFVSSNRLSTGSSKSDKGFADDKIQQQNKEYHQPSLDRNNSSFRSINQESNKEKVQVFDNTRANNNLQKSKIAVSKVDSLTNGSKPSPPFPKVDYATELFRMLCSDSAENKSISLDADSWVKFESDDDVPLQKREFGTKSLSMKVHPEPKAEDFQKPLGMLTIKHTHEHQKDIKADNERVLQQVQNIQPVKNVTNVGSYPMSNLYRPAMPINRVASSPAGKRLPLPVSGNNYDFSFLTQEMFTKR